MWQPGWRDEIWSRLDEDWDIIVVGGGITGAGILREAVRAGYRALLVEAQDFAGGTSSRSSKLVHGGLRYLANAQFRVTYESVHERELLLKGGCGLVNRLDILMPNADSNRVPPWAFGLGLVLYSLMARKRSFGFKTRANLTAMIPQLSPSGLSSAFQYYDANADDARLTLRVIREAVAAGGTAINYVRAADVLRDQTGRVRGVRAEDRAGDRQSVEVRARLVINAAGAWADGLREKVGGARRLRPLQGSHLVLPFDRLPLKQSVSVFHPRDGRPVFTLPWESVTLVGTTDIDIGHQFSENPSITADETGYLLEFLAHTYPMERIGPEDVLCTLYGIRPVIDTGKANPSKESREHAIWLEDGLLTVTGGKLTTFRLMARDVMKAARKLAAPSLPGNDAHSCLQAVPPEAVETAAGQIAPASALRLAGRYGGEAAVLLAEADPGSLTPIEDTPYLWAELRWAAGMEGIVHLDDLLLRRVRLGLLLPAGGIPLLPRIRETAQPELGWDDARWERETERYIGIWNTGYRVK
jgi:glycerol-3-phosphate dehydrogenase